MPSAPSRSWSLRVALGFCVAFGLQASAAQLLADAGDAAQGPIQVANQYPFALLHSSLAPRAARTLPAGELRMSSTFSWTNTENYRPAYVVDLETRVATLSAEYGVSDALQLGAVLPLVSRGGGKLDALIDGWHEFFHFRRGDRKTFEDNQYNWFAVDGNGEVSRFERSGTGLGDLTFDAQYRFLRRGAWQAALYGAVRLPTADETFGAGGTDVTAALLSQWCGEQVCVYEGLGVLHYGDTSLNLTTYLRDHVEGFVTVEYPWNEDVAFTAGLYVSSKFLGDVPGHPSYSVYLDTGISTKIGPTEALRFLLRENPAPRSGTADVTFLWGWEKGF